VHRDLHDGRIWYARAEVLVEESPDGPVLTYWGPGADARAPVHPVDGHALRVPTTHWGLEPRPWHSTHVLSWWSPGDAYSLWLFWEAKSWRFMGWYMNMQSPFCRTSIGFDATDDILDVWIEPDGTWAWKDSDELDEAVRAGACKAQAARAIRREATQAIEAIPRREPFTHTWTTWRPDPDWPVPQLEPTWESAPLSSLGIGS